MKVLKFGGTSVGSASIILKVKNIVRSNGEPVIVVVSALSGVTDQLIQAAHAASESDPLYKSILASIRERHLDVISELGIWSDALAKDIEDMTSELVNICSGVALLQILPKKTEAQIVSYGERLASRILVDAFDGCRLADSLSFIKTKSAAVGDIVESDLTASLIKKEFADFGADGKSVIVPGFISTDNESGDISNLGRGGSDYTASLIAAALDADVLEIWTDVDGFMSADPKIIKTSYVIEEMTYGEAMELCNFGARVIYPPALYPVCAKNIPIKVKNSFKPESVGTTIKKNCRRSDRTIRGISSIDNVSLITLSGTSMMGIIGIDSRIFTSLSQSGISVFLVSQSSSETCISIGVSSDVADLACKVISDTFSHEINTGALNPVEKEDELAAVAVIGENMKGTPGTAGKLFSTLGRNSISIIACAQSASESNISFVVKRSQLRKSLNVIHDSFFLSEFQELNLFICGTGTVGSRLIEQIASQKEKLMKDRNLKINIVGIARSKKGIFDRAGVSTQNWKDQLEAEGISINPEILKSEVIGMNIFNSVFVDCTASAEIAALYEDFFKHGISVVAANKIAASSDYAMYRRLKDTARERGVKFLFETNVGAGLPIIGTINDLCNSGDRIIRMEAVLSGTLNFIFNTISKDIPFSQTVKMACEQGFAEPDPRIDLSGKDVIRKLVILSREAGYQVNQEDVSAELFIPKSFFDCSMDEFWEKLPSLDAEFEARRLKLESENKRWRFVAKMDEGKLSVSLREIANQHSFYVLDGSNNIILLTTERYNRHPMLIQGYGAGADVTAAGVFADIMSIANI